MLIRFSRMLVQLVQLSAALLLAACQQSQAQARLDDVPMGTTVSHQFSFSDCTELLLLRLPPIADAQLQLPPNMAAMPAERVFQAMGFVPRLPLDPPLALVGFMGLLSFECNDEGARQHFTANLVAIEPMAHPDIPVDAAEWHFYANGLGADKAWRKEIRKLGIAVPDLQGTAFASLAQDTPGGRAISSSITLLRDGSLIWTARTYPALRYVPDPINLHTRLWLDAPGQEGLLGIDVQENPVVYNSNFSECRIAPGTDAGTMFGDCAASDTAVQNIYPQLAPVYWLRRGQYLSSLLPRD